MIAVGGSIGARALAAPMRSDAERPQVPACSSDLVVLSTEVDLPVSSSPGASCVSPLLSLRHT